MSMKIQVLEDYRGKATQDRLLRKGDIIDTIRDKWATLERVTYLLSTFPQWFVVIERPADVPAPAVCVPTPTPPAVLKAKTKRG